MSYPLNYPTPQNANVQILYKTDDWVKPQGASFVWITLIGGGGGGAGGDPSLGSVGAGGSAAVTNFMGPAFLIPDVLRVSVGTGGAGGVFGGNGGNGVASSLIYQQKDGTGYTLLTANGGGQGTIPTPGAGGAASTSNFFSCMGFFQSIAGQSATSSNPGASTTTFLSAGASVGPVDANYGYRSPGPSVGTAAVHGFSMVSPIIVGVGGSGGTGSSWGNGGNGGIGCGGGGGGVYTSGPTSIGGRGGDGLAVIITW